MIENNMLLVLTHDNKIKTSQTQYLIKNNVTLFLEWHCEVFDHTKTITSQLGTTGHTACGNKSRTCDVAICACPTDINLPKAIDKDTLANFRDLVSKITKYSISRSLPSTVWNNSQQNFYLKLDLILYNFKEEIHSYKGSSKEESYVSLH